jgi:peroxiredoxin
MNKNLPLLLLLLSVTLVQCGITPKATDQPVYEKVYLTFFAGVSCVPCQKELPQVRDHLAELGADRERVHTQVYMVAGKNFGKLQPNDEQKFAKDYALPFEMLRDEKCREVASLYFEDCAVPKAVIRTEDGKALYTYPVAQVDQVLSDLKSVLGKKSQK